MFSKGTKGRTNKVMNMTGSKMTGILHEKVEYAGGVDVELESGKVGGNNLGKKAEKQPAVKSGEETTSTSEGKTTATSKKEGCLDGSNDAERSSTTTSTTATASTREGTGCLGGSNDDERMSSTTAMAPTLDHSLEADDWVPPLAPTLDRMSPENAFKKMLEGAKDGHGKRMMKTAGRRRAGGRKQPPKSKTQPATKGTTRNYFPKLYSLGNGMTPKRDALEMEQEDEVRGKEIDDDDGVSADSNPKKLRLSTMIVHPIFDLRGATSKTRMEWYGKKKSVLTQFNEGKTRGNWENWSILLERTPWGIL